MALPIAPQFEPRTLSRAFTNDKGVSVQRLDQRANIVLAQERLGKVMSHLLEDARQRGAAVEHLKHGIFKLVEPKVPQRQGVFQHINRLPVLPLNADDQVGASAKGNPAS
jgi:hypothetical protein